MTDVRTATRAFYDRYSYDFETDLHSEMQLDGSLLGRALGSVGAGDTVVDAGCGTGLVSRLARRCTPARAVIGLDLSAQSLRRAADRSSGIGFVRGDILQLPIRSDAIDLVISRGVIMTTGAPDRAFRELARITRPDGHLFVRVYNRRHPYHWLYRLLGPACRAIAGVPGGKTLLAVFAVPIFILITELAFLVMRGRFTRIAPRVAWNFFADQFLVPHNSFHTAEEVRAWGAAANCRCLADQAVTLGQQIEFLFVRSSA